jgi:hypothetical protein
MMDDGNDEVRGTFLRFSFFDPRVLHHNSHARAVFFPPTDRLLPVNDTPRHSHQSM